MEVNLRDLHNGSTFSQDDRQDIVDYLARRHTLNNREYVAGLLATPMCVRMGLDQTSLDLRSPNRAERFLEQVARAFEIQRLDE